MPPDAADRADPLAWFKTITYQEIHAFQIGAALCFLAAVASNAAVLGAYLAIGLWALGVRASPRRDTHSGDTDTIADDEMASHGAHSKLLTQIRREPHYYISGGAVGDRVGYYAHRVVFDADPTHYEQLPEIVETLTLGL